ncbi:MAG: hypothetical protein U0269_36945 [Polyangiales bacterium]
MIQRCLFLCASIVAMAGSARAQTVDASVTQRATPLATQITAPIATNATTSERRDEPTVDDLTTREGVRIVGRVVEVHPAAGTVVVLEGNDQRRTVRWAEIGTMTGPSFVEDRSVFSRVPVLGRAPLRVRSPHAQLIEVTWGMSRLRPSDHQEGGELHRARCETPCTLWLPATRVLVQSEAPELARGTAFVELRDGGTTVQLHASDRAQRSVADGLLVGGLAGVEIGLLTVLGAFLAQPNGGPTLDTGLVVGGAIGGAGVAAALVGAAIGATVPTGARSVEHGAPRSLWGPRTTDGALAPWQRETITPTVIPSR